MCQQWWGTIHNFEGGQRSAYQERGTTSCVQCVPPHHETDESACGRSHHLSQGGSLCIRNIECFTLCLVCCGVCVAISGVTMGPDSHGGNLNGSGSIRSLIPVILIRDGILIMVIYMNYPEGSVAMICFHSFQTQKEVSLIFQSIAFQMANQAGRPLATIQESVKL